MKYIDCKNPRYLFSVVVAPIERLNDVPLWGRVGALVLAAFQFLAADLLLSLLPIFVLAAGFDFYYGVKASKWKDIPYNADRASSGVHVKASGLVIVGLLSLIERWLSSHSLGNTRGALSVALAMVLISLDIVSIEKHRQQLGAGPIPLLSAMLEWIQALLTKRIPGFMVPPQKDQGDK